MKFIISILMTFSLSFLYSQNQQRIVLADDGIFTLSLGTIITTSTYYIHNEYKKDGGEMTPVIYGGVSFATSITVGLYIISFDKKPKRITKSKNPRWL